MGKGHASLDLKLEETSNTADLGQMLLAIQKQGGELVTM